MGWSIGYDDNWKRVYRLCAPCDIRLNRYAMRFLGVPDVAKKIKAYSGSD